MNRRQFGGQLGSLAVGGVLVGVGQETFAARPRRPGAQVAPVVVGMHTYSYRDHSLDLALVEMGRLGIPQCELWQGHLLPPDPVGKDPRVARREWRTNTPMSFFEEIAVRFKKAGIRLHAYNYTFREDFSDGELHQGFEAAKALGVEVLTASASKAVIPRLAIAARAHKMRVGIHNHSKVMPNEFATPGDFEKAISGKGAEYLAIDLDIGHFTAANFDAVAFVRKHHARIVGIRVKDRKRDQGEGVAFGEGQTPIKEVLTLLRDKGFGIPAHIECEYRGKDHLAEIARSVQFCRQALAV